mgnify:CR=1 FL=1
MTAHPRSRGEHSTTPSTTGGFDGSSPLTRGALLLLHILRQQHGLIPAHAGSTLPSRWT